MTEQQSVDKLFVTQEITLLGATPNFKNALLEAGAPPDDVDLVAAKFQNLSSDPMLYAPGVGPFVDLSLTWVLLRPIAIQTDLMLTPVKGGVIHIVQMCPRLDGGVHVYMQNVLVMLEDVPWLSTMIIEETKKAGTPYMFGQLGGMEYEHINPSRESDE